MHTRLLVFAASLGLSLGMTAAFVMPASAASTKTSQTKTDDQPQYICNLKGCTPIHKATSHKSKTESQSGSGAAPGTSSQHGTPPHP